MFFRSLAFLSVLLLSLSELPNLYNYNNLTF